MEHTLILIALLMFAIGAAVRTGRICCQHRDRRQADSGVRVTRKLLISLSVAAVLAWGATKYVQNIFPQTFGFFPSSGGGTLGITNNAASSQIAAFSLYVPTSPFSGSMRLKDVRLRFGSLSGSPKATASLYTDSGGKPGTLVEAGTEVTLAAGWNTLGGFTATAAVSADTQYWVLVKCTTGTSAVAYFNTTYGGSSNAPFGTGVGGAGQTAGNAYTAVQSADNGGTWTTWRPMINGVRFGLTDGTDDAYMGQALDAFSYGNGASAKLYTNAGTAQEFGVHFTLPANAKARVIGAIMNLRQYGTATGNVKFKLYTGAYNSPALKATSKAITGSTVATTGNNFYRAYFDSAVEIAGGTEVTLTAVNTAADDASNYFAANGFGQDTDSPSLAILPFGMYSVTYSGGSWSQGTNFSPFWGLMLDDTGQFAESGGGQSGYIYQQ